MQPTNFDDKPLNTSVTGETVHTLNEFARYLWMRYGFTPRELFGPEHDIPVASLYRFLKRKGQFPRGWTPELVDRFVKVVARFYVMEPSECWDMIRARARSRVPDPAARSLVKTIFSGRPWSSALPVSHSGERLAGLLRLYAAQRNANRHVPKRL